MWGALACASIAIVLASVFGFQRGMLNREIGELSVELAAARRKIKLLESALRAAQRPPLTGPQSVDALLRVPNDPSI